MIISYRRNALPSFTSIASPAWTCTSGGGGTSWTTTGPAGARGPPPPGAIIGTAANCPYADGAAGSGGLFIGAIAPSYGADGAGAPYGFGAGGWCGCAPYGFGAGAPYAGGASPAYAMVVYLTRTVRLSSHLVPARSEKSETALDRTRLKVECSDREFN